jgi:hypothetical protein
MKLGMIPKRAPISLARLEQDRAVGLLERLAERDRHFVDARAGLGVQPLDRHAEGEHLVHQRVHELAVAVHAQERIAEHAWRDRLRIDAALGGPRLRRLEEVEPLELHPAHRNEPHLLGAREDALQGLARADRRRRVVGLTNSPRKKGTLPSHGTVPLRREVEARERIRKAVLPAGERRVVVGLVADVPAEDDVAEAEAAGRRGLGGAEELVDVQVLAAQDAVDVADRDLDLAAAALADRGRARDAREVGVVMTPFWARPGTSGHPNRTERPSTDERDGRAAAEATNEADKIAGAPLGAPDAKPPSSLDMSISGAAGR